MATFIEIDEVKQIELNILKFIDEICRENKLQYYLVGGTLIGAIRHKGFIPWDDDIDISMPRGDYNKFVEIINRGNYSPYKLESYETNKNYPYTFAKIVDNRTMSNEMETRESYGIAVDVFIIDGIGNNTLYAKIMTRILTILRSLFALSFGSRHSTTGKRMMTVIRFPFWIVSTALGSERIYRWIKRCVGKKGFETSSWVGCVTCGRYGQREIMPKSVFGKSIEVAFEEFYFQAPAEFDKYLTTLYGDYMEPPPIWEQRPIHQIKAWWKDSGRNKEEI